MDDRSARVAAQSRIFISIFEKVAETAAGEYLLCKEGQPSNGQTETLGKASQ